MLKSQIPVRALVVILCLFALAAVASTSAFGQDFTLQASPMNPSSVLPGGSSISTLTLSTLNSTSAVNVGLSCAVTAGPAGAPPTCVISPDSVSTPGSATITVTATGTGGATLAGSYTITITGEGPSTTHQTSVIFSVIAVSPQYSLSVTSALSPTSVHPGSGASAIISIVPTAGYGGPDAAVTLSCASVTPAVTLSPVCTFTPAPPVPVPSSAPVPVTLVINTTGPIVTTPGTAPHRSIPFIIFFPLSGLALIAGLGSKKSRNRRLLGITFLFAMAMSLLLMPACGNSNTSNTSNPNGNTPNNTYTFSLTGSDATGTAPSNATDVSVTLTVN
jgi:hypothetical protein